MRKRRMDVGRDAFDFSRGNVECEGEERGASLGEKRSGIERLVEAITNHYWKCRRHFSSIIASVGCLGSVQASTRSRGGKVKDSTGRSAPKNDLALATHTHTHTCMKPQLIERYVLGIGREETLPRSAAPAFERRMHAGHWLQIDPTVCLALD